jgi:flagellar assembly protein FliH
LEGEQRARAELAPLMERLARTIADLSSTRDAFRREAEEDVVRLSLGVARRILHRELSIDPEALTGVVHVALGKFEGRELHRVLVSPDDHAAVSAALGSLRLPRRVEVIADPTLERGAALFETVKGTLDASVDTQLDEIERGFLDVLGKEGRRG